MLLKSLSIRGLHRTLNLDVTFDRQVTLLVGINGSGKTSILNVIDWLLRPDFRRLALAQFDSLILRFEENSITYELAAKKSAKVLTISVEGPKAPMKPITVNLRLPAEFDDEMADGYYENLSPESHEIPLWEFLTSISPPTFLSLDRTVSAETDHRFYVDARASLKTRRLPARPPIRYVEEVMSSKYAEYRAQAIENDNELKANIVMSALQSPEMVFRGDAIEKMTPREITSLERKVSTYLSATIKSVDVDKQVHSFFAASRLFANEQGRASDSHDSALLFLMARYRQIDGLAKAFNEFEKKNSQAFKPLNEYLEAVNKFFVDSNKTLYFDESTGRLAFSWGDVTGVRPKGNSIARLSSGERQVIVLFTFLAFSSKPNNVFMVDEPELSLHPKWQSEFMEEFLNLRPEKTQLLLATHSPDIVGKYKEHCIVLRGGRV